MHRLDHILWGASSLESGIAEFATMTGVTLAPGGRHPGFGTHNALASFGDHTYLEIIAPDPTQELAGTLGAFLQTFERPALFHFAITTSNIDNVARNLRALGIGSRLVPMSRTRADGVTLNWRNLYPEEHDFGFALPFFIQWDTDFHPSRLPAVGLTRDSFTVHHPRVDELRRLYAGLDIPVEIVAAERAEFRALIGTPKGPVELAGLIHG